MSRRTYRYEITYEHGQALDKVTTRRINITSQKPSRRTLLLALLQWDTQMECARILACVRCGWKMGKARKSTHNPVKV